MFTDIFDTFDTPRQALFKAKPTSASFTDIFNMLLLYIMGCTWAFVLPTAESFHQEGKAWDTARRVMRVINPSKTFGLKEHAISLIIASIGFLGGYAVDALATAKLFFNAHLNPAKVILGLFSLSTIGLGLVGVLAPAIVYPSELVYWNGIPTCHGFQALHYSKGDQVDRRRKTFGWCLLAAFTWEFVPAYMAPWLNGISIPCLASMHASENRRKTISRIFGGASANQGLGLFSISLDPQYVPFSTFAGSPTKFLIPYFSGAILGAFILIALYQTNVWNAKAYPFMSSTLYTATGDAWDQNAVFDPQYRLNETGLAEQGLPRMAVSEAFSIMTTALGLGALIAHVLLFLSKTVIEDFRRVRNGSLDDPHYQAMKKYKAVPQKVWLLFMALGVPAAFVTIYVGHTTLPWWGLVVALVFGVLMTPISLSIYGRFGSAVPTMMISKMISGACHPDHPVANLWFALYSHNIVEVSGTVAGYLKLGQYLKLPPRLNLAAQLTSVLLGAFTQWIMTSAIIDRHADILRDPQGDAYWFGGLWQDANVEATEWSMASRVFAVSSGTDYEWLPLGIMIGACFPLAHWLLTKRVKFIRDLGDLIVSTRVRGGVECVPQLQLRAHPSPVPQNLPIFLYYLATLSGGVNSAFFSSMLLAYGRSSPAASLRT